MLIKSADDKSKRMELLTDLQKSPLLNARQRAWLRDELMRLQRGLQGERDAAHYIDNAFKSGANNAVIHDLRIVVDGEVAQIDHLIVNRTLTFYLLETKCFGGNVQINGRGEFAVEYPGDKIYGIESPLEQSRRHERVLVKLLDKLEITGRMGVKPRFFHAVLFHPKALITRPERKEFDTDNVIMADQIATWHSKHIDRDVSVGAVLSAFVNVHSPDTTKAWAEKITRQHRPVSQLELPDFMTPREVPTLRPAPARKSEPIQPQAVITKPAEAVSASTTSTSPPDELRRKLVCGTCRQKISFPEGKFCWNNEARFGGFQYCREHQAQFK